VEKVGLLITAKQLCEITPRRKAVSAGSNQEEDRWYGCNNFCRWISKLRSRDLPYTPSKQWCGISDISIDMIDWQ
jgi:hypothetical protein